MAEKTKTVSHVKHVPKDAQVIMSIIKDMGITDYEPKVINQLLEFTYRYITCILDDSKVYANHAKKKFIDIEDVRLAVKMQLERAFTNPPPRDVLLDVARAKNNIPLPFVKPNNGLRLPPDRYCLNSTNYRLKSEDKNETKKQIGKSINSTFVGAAARGNKADGRGPGVVKRSGTLSTVAKTQTITMPKPVLKFSTGGTGAGASTMNKPKTPILTTQAQTPAAQAPIQSTVKMEIDESTKRKREDDDYDIP